MCRPGRHVWKFEAKTVSNELMSAKDITKGVAHRWELEMKKSTFMICALTLTVQTLFTGCGAMETRQNPEVFSSKEEDITAGNAESKEETALGEIISLDENILELEDGLQAVRFEGEDGFARFLADGGAESDSEVVDYLKEQLLADLPNLIFGGTPFGCSTIMVRNQEGGYYFGRNFDWNSCNGLIISAKPASGYASVSTVNMDFIQAGGVSLSDFPDTIQALIGLYAPIDGMNEMGLAVSVNMIQDTDTIAQNTPKPDLTTTTAIRLLLNQAADVEEAVSLLEQYDMHASMGMMVHFAIADNNGRSVAVEYVNQEMIVTDTPIVTNFYMALGEKYGVGTPQSHVRFDLLKEALKNNVSMSGEGVRNALDSVSKDNFDEFESTEWSIVMNQEAKEMTYYHRENYRKGYIILIE